jgi:hypothetical protein
MTRADDRLSKPAAGRYFPLAFSELLSQVEKFPFAVHDYHKRIPIFMENCLAECDRGFQLCSLMRMNYLAVFSLPTEVPHGIARRSIEMALQRFSEIDAGTLPTILDQQFVVYRAFLGPVGALSITQHVVSGGHRSYLQFQKASQLPKAASSTKGQKELISVQVV